MDMIFGKFQTAYAESHPVLALCFHTNKLKTRWAHSAAIADFFSSYVVNDTFVLQSRQKPEDLKHTIAYIVNELAENAVKFNSGDLLYLQVYDTGTALSFVVENGMDPKSLSPFTKLLEELSTGDAGELLIQRIEENALGGKSGSGLGFLTLMSDYGIELGWRIYEPNDKGLRVQTLASFTYIKRD